MVTVAVVTAVAGSGMENSAVVEMEEAVRVVVVMAVVVMAVEGEEGEGTAVAEKEVAEMGALSYCT